MKDYVVEVLFQDAHNNTQQEIFELSAKSKQIAENRIRNLIADEGGTITYLAFRK